MRYPLLGSIFFNWGRKKMPGLFVLKVSITKIYLKKFVLKFWFSHSKIW